MSGKRSGYNNAPLDEGETASDEQHEHKETHGQRWPNVVKKKPESAMSIGANPPASAAKLQSSNVTPSTLE